MSKYKLKAVPNLEISAGDTSTEILDKLTSALKTDGDFPAQAQLVSELRRMTQDPNTSIGQIVDLIMKDGTVATRVLHVVNSAVYRRNQTITTVSQAVMQLGMGPLGDICAGLILVEKFLPTAKKGGPFAETVKKSFLVSIICSYLLNRHKQKGLAEQGFLAATFHSLGYLLLAYYFPQVIESASKRAIRKRHDITQSISEILGLNTLELSLTVLNALKIPEYFQNIIIIAHKSFSERGYDTTEDKLANAIAIAEEFATLISRDATNEEIKSAINSNADISRYSKEELTELIRLVPDLFTAHCKMTGMTMLSVNQELISFDQVIADDQEDLLLTDDSDEKFATYLNEIKESIANHEPLSSIVTTAMEALVYVLDYDRALLLLAEASKRQLSGRIAIGNSIDFNPKEIARSVVDSTTADAPDILAYKNCRPVYVGVPIFANSQHHAAIPIGDKDGAALGVIYADVVAADGKPKCCNRAQQKSLAVLSELLSKAGIDTNQVN